MGADIGEGPVGKGHGGHVGRWRDGKREREEEKK